MKAQLRDYVTVSGSSTRHVDLARIDWARRVVWLPDGRWVPFEQVLVADEPPLLAYENVNKDDRVAYVCACGRPFESRQALGGHARSCRAR